MGAALAVLAPIAAHGHAKHVGIVAIFLPLLISILLAVSAATAAARARSRALRPVLAVSGSFWAGVCLGLVPASTLLLASWGMPAGTALARSLQQIAALLVIAVVCVTVSALIACDVARGSVAAGADG